MDFEENINCSVEFLTLDTFMNRVIITLLYLPFFMLSWSHVTAQPELSGAYHAGDIKTYGIDDGLPDRCVMSAFVDTLGKLNVVPCVHVQLGYEQNLYQLDGYRPLLDGILMDVPDEPGALVPEGIGPGGIHYGVFLDFEGIIISGASAYFYDPVAGEIERVQPKDPEGNLLNVWQVERYEGEYYFLGQGATTIFLLKYRAGTTEIVASIEMGGQATVVDRAFPMYLDDEVLWFALSDGLFRYDLRNSQLRNWSVVSLPLAWTPVESIDFFRMPDGDFLIRDALEGKVYTYDNESKEINLFDKLPEMFAPIGIETPTYVYEDRSKNLLFIQKTKESVGYIAALCTSDGKWHDYSDIIGSITAGLGNKFTENDFQGEDFRRQIYRSGYDLVVAEVSNHHGVRSQTTTPMRGMAEFGMDSVHTMGNRLIVDDRDGLSIIYNYKVCLTERVFDSDIHIGIDNSWWYSMDNGGITKRDPESGNCEIYFPDRQITRMTIESDSTIIYTTSRSEIVRWNYPKMSTNTIDSGSIEGSVNYIYVDPSGKIWIASSAGLFLCDTSQEMVEVRSISLPVSDVAILTVLDDHKGSLWLGTFAKGLIIYEVSTGRSTLLKEESGLSDNTVASLVKDDDGVIWAGTFRGITLLDDKQVIGHVYQKDGLIDNDCNRWSVLKASDGDLYFGTPYGVSVIEPEIVKSNVLGRRPPKVFLSLIQTNDTSLIQGSTAIHNSIETGIRLPAASRNLRVAYALSEYSAPEKARFAYRVGDGAWNYIGNVHDLDLIDLPKGEYHLYIKGADERGQWSSNTIAIPIDAAAFFYEQWWFYLLCGLLVILIAILWQLRQQREKRQLELEVAARTATIRQQADALRELDRVKSKLYTNITHEFRTPLTVIEGLADKSGIDPKAPGIIKRNVRNLLNLVNQMLDLRKLESGNLSVNAVQADVLNYIKYVGESFGSIAHSKNISINYTLSPDGFLMDFDPEKLERILSNLISNAIKFTPAEGSIEIRATGSDEFLEVSVADSGVGISEGDIDKIFHRYYQADTEVTRRGEGTGIGLTLVSELLHLLGGSISVTSEPGVGSTFTFLLPVSREAQLAETPVIADIRGETGFNDEADLQELIGEQLEEDKDLILLVEDNHDVLRYVASCLKDDFNLAYAMDGGAGINKAIELTPSIIISDVMMPEVSGYELCDTLKQDIRTSHIPIILLTAKADMESKLEGLKFGADEYLQKPFNREELEVRIANLIANRKKIHQRYSSFEEFPPAENATVQHEDEFILKFRKLIDDNLEEEQFGIPEICDAMHLGKSQLHKKIRMLTGKTPIQYMRSVKLNKARALLLSSANISEVAFDLGYKDPKYFARVFKEEFGDSPSDYIKAHIKR